MLKLRAASAPTETRPDSYQSVSCAIADKIDLKGVGAAPEDWLLQVFAQQGVSRSAGY